MIFSLYASISKNNSKKVTDNIVFIRSYSRVNVWLFCIDCSHTSQNSSRNWSFCRFLIFLSTFSDNFGDIKKKRWSKIAANVDLKNNLC